MRFACACYLPRALRCVGCALAFFVVLRLFKRTVFGLRSLKERHFCLWDTVKGFDPNRISKKARSDSMEDSSLSVKCSNPHV